MYPFSPLVFLSKSEDVIIVNIFRSIYYHRYSTHSEKRGINLENGQGF